MTNRLRLFLVLTMVLFLGNVAMAQISEKGIPASFSYDSNILRSTKIPFKTPVLFDVEKLKAEDKISEENNNPLRTSIIIPVDLDTKNSGEWTTLSNGQDIWTLTISAPDAIATMLYYDDFYIPSGGKLFIYNEDRTHILGAYTNQTNPANGAFATEFVAGDLITLEYNAPLANLQFAADDLIPVKQDMPRIKISGVGYGYNYLKVFRTRSDIFKIGESESCQVNINCPEGDNWQDQKKGVAKSVTPIGIEGFLCSGTLINNTSQDLTPFFLTASHCFWDGSATLNNSNWNQIVYYFHYESPGCTTDFPLETRTVVGAQMLVELRISGGSDGVLLRLNDEIPLDWDLYFNGWDRRNIAATGGVGIHHPGGDIKKISTYTSTATSATWNGSGSIGATGAHWNVNFVATASGHGVTQGGSSGSPMFNQNGLVVGTLTGGNSSCEYLNGSNLYGKLWYHWDNANAATAQGVDNTKRMKDYLDPGNTGAETLNGTYTQNNLPVADFEASSTNIYVLESVAYTNRSVSATSWNWTFQGGTPSNYSGQTPPPVVYNAAGTFTTTLVVSDGASNQDTKTETINVTIKGTPTQPVADFAVAGLVFSEGFDVAGILPSSANWNVQNGSSHVSPGQWVQGNLTSYPTFSTIDPSSLASAAISWNLAYSDSWLVTTNNYPILAGSTIEYYAGYDGTYLPYATLNFLISDDNGATWTQLWTAGSSTISRAWSWTKYSFDLSAYAGQNLKFAWQYVGADGNSMAIDGVKFFGASAQTTINVGDFLSPVDFSTGDPVLWDWTFDGATPVNASGEAPRVQYMTAGVYNVSLTVTNTVGTDSKTIPNMVTVVDQPAAVAFTSESQGYVMRESYGPYLPPNNTVNFKDLTQNYPLSWNWTFSGATPASSTDQHPQNITYATAGLHDVSLVASNSAGPQSKTVPGYVKVGYNDPTPVWNMVYGEAFAVYTYDGLAIFGSTAYGGSMFSERFDAPMVGGTISKIDIKCLRTASSSGNMTVAVFTDNNGIPGTQLATVNVPINNLVQSSTASYYTVNLPTPVMVTGAFHIRISGLNSSGSGTTGRYVYIASAASRGPLAKNTAYIYYANAWRAASAVIGDLNTSLDIVPYFAYSSDTSVDFGIEPAYALKSNNNPYIPTNIPVNFTDLSTGFPPNSWDWTFQGGTPATSNLQSPQVAYATDGTYNVSLDVTNLEGGSGTLTKPGYVKAVMEEHNAIWNMLPGEAGTTSYSWTGGTTYVTGHNNFGITAYSERFDAPLTTGKISKVEILFNRSAAPSGTLTISLAKDEGGFPGTVLTSEQLVANTTNFPSNGQRLITVNFSTPVLVSDAYHIVVSGYSGTSSGGVRNVNVCTALDRGSGKNTFYFLDNGDWLNVADDIELFTSLNIAPHFAYTNPISTNFVWTGLAEDNDWYTASNWLPQAVPGSLDIVHIPEAPNYPVLDQATTVAEIHFEPGAQLGGQSYLTANAFVSYDFKSENGKRGTWNMLSIPLGEVFPGDFAFGGYPITWVRTFQADEESSVAQGTWVTARGGNTGAFTFGDGFAIWLNEDESGEPFKGLKVLDETHELPYFHLFEEPPGSEARIKHDNFKNNTHEYISGIGDGIGQSTFYNYVKDDNGEYAKYTVDRFDAAYRLLDESSYNKEVHFYGNFAMTGNPYMATLDFEEFIKSANSGKIKDTYYVWTGSGYTTYSTQTGPGGIETAVPLNEFIAPLQGFIVEKKAETGPSASLNFDESSMFSANPGVLLRSSSTASNKLDILARNTVAGVRTTIANREGGQDEFGDLDARKIMGAISDVPEVYTLKPYKNGMIAATVNIINNDDILIPVGLATNYKGNITLTFSGMDSYDANLSLIDAETNRTIDLTGLATCEYVVDYTPKQVNGKTAVCEDRLFIRISKTVTGLNETIAEKVNVFESNGFIQIISSAANPIKEVAVYDLQGAMIYKTNNINAVSHTVERNLLSGVYVVRVLAEKSLDNVKVVK